ncbi:MAG: hypothetical protein R3F42_00150 [Pseudomonadota bacterium]
MPDQNILISSTRYDVGALEADVKAARQAMDFGTGVYGHSLSLPRASDIEPSYREHRNNVPYADALELCPLFAGIFHGFLAPKVSFRLLRRTAGSAYSIHDDRDMGEHIVRMQLPVITNPGSLFMIQKDGAELEPIARRIAEITRSGQPLVFDYPRLVQSFGEWFDLFTLEPGYFNLIETNKVHTLINAGTTDRVTLAIDLLRNDWLDDWLARNITGKIAPLPPDKLPAGTWEWSALQHGLLCHPRLQLS